MSRFEPTEVIYGYAHMTTKPLTQVVLILLTTMGHANFLWAAGESSVSKSQLICERNGKIKFSENKKTKEEPAAYCWSRKLNVILSYDCVISEKCEAMRQFPLKFNTQTTAGAVGTPEFHYCHLVGGLPQIMQYRTKSTWQSDEICRFDDKSYISLRLLALRN